jgi:hypothetical protein
MYEIGDILTLKKQHPCGGKTWQVARVGADIKLQCKTCGKYVNVMRDDLKKRVKSVDKSAQGANA